jgi:hypothetical protein
MRRRRESLPNQFKPLRMGPPRVVEDSELYQIVASFGDDARKCCTTEEGQKLAAEMEAHVHSWCMPWEDWQLGVIALRAQLFLACIRKELGGRKKLDPQQLRLQEGL